MKRTATKEMCRQWARLAKRSEASQAAVIKANRAYWRRFFAGRKQPVVDPLS